MFPADRWRYLRASRVIIHLPSYVRMAWGIWRDSRTPVWLKALLGAALAYVVMPIDIIPDVVPLIGQADDLTVLILVLDLFVSNAPPEVKAEHLRRAKDGSAILDRDLARARRALGPRFEQFRASLPDLLERYGGLTDQAARAQLKSAVSRAPQTPTPQPQETEVS